VTSWCTCHTVTPPLYTVTAKLLYNFLTAFFLLNHVIAKMRKVRSHITRDVCTVTVSYPAVSVFCASFPITLLTLSDCCNLNYIPKPQHSCFDYSKNNLTAQTTNAPITYFLSFLITYFLGPNIFPNDLVLKHQQPAFQACCNILFSNHVIQQHKYKLHTVCLISKVNKTIHSLTEETLSVLLSIQHKTQ
jgi:hypothetical protein